MARVVLDSAGVAALLSESGVQELLTAQAERVAAVARSTAPVKTGAYRDSIHVESGPSPIDGRARAIVTADVTYADAVEARTGNLARALGSIGGQ